MMNKNFEKAISSLITLITLLYSNECCLCNDHVDQITLKNGYIYELNINKIHSRGMIFFDGQGVMYKTISKLLITY